MRRSALLLVIVAGCAAPQQRVELLEDNVRGYEEGLRWRRYDDAAARRMPSQREAFLDERDRVDEDLRFDDYEIQRMKMKRGHQAAQILVKVTWHLDSVGTVHDTIVEQDWELHGKYWMLRDERRRRGEPMPGLKEPKPKAPDPDAPIDPAEDKTAANP